MTQTPPDQKPAPSLRTTYRRARAADDACGSLMAVVELLDALLSVEQRSRPGVRADLDHLDREIQQLRSAMRSSSADWAEVRADAVTRLRHQRGILYPWFRPLR
jgi:hypothetical protein